MNTSTRRMIRWVLGASLTLTACGCVNIKKQLILIKLDVRNDSIAILVTHEGFSVYLERSQDMAADLAEAKKHLAASASSSK